MKIAIIGAGIVGAAAAHALLDEGHEVLILDKEGPAFGPSRGNAGIIAHTDVLPIAGPNMLRKVPGFLLDPLGRMRLTTDGYMHLLRLLHDAAARLCSGRIAMITEGGYHLDAVRDCLERAIRDCMASLYTDRAIAYRAARGIEHGAVALSVGVQRMVRSDLACAA